jgi:hypothetical protein
MEIPSESSSGSEKDKRRRKNNMNFSNTSNDFVQWDALADTKWGRIP